MNYVVVINTYKRPTELVERCLKSVITQKYPPLRIILIDQNDPALIFSPEIKNCSILEVQNVKTSGVSKARNSAKIPDCEWIAFCDDDGYMDNNYSEVLGLTIKNNPDAEIIAGSIIRDDNFEYYSPRHAIGGNINLFRNTKLLMGSNFATKKKTFERLGKFDEDFGVGGKWGSGEESDFAWNAYFSQVPMLYNKELRVLHIKPYDGDISHSVDKAYKYGIGKGALVAKWLVKKNKVTVIYELIEMTIVPLLKAIHGLVMFDKKKLLTSLHSLRGRFVGFFKFIANS